MTSKELRTIVNDFIFASFFLSVAVLLVVGVFMVSIIEDKPSVSYDCEHAFVYVKQGITFTPFRMTNEEFNKLCGE